MKFIATADIHLHPHRQCSNSAGTDRLEDGLSALRQTLEFAQVKHCAWVFLGDLKHVKGVWHQTALNRAMEILNQFEDVPKVMVHGNHDGLGGGSGLLPFGNEHTAVIDKPMILKWAGLHAAVWPHRKDVSELPELIAEAKAHGVKLFLGHIFLANSVVGPIDTPIIKGERLEHIGLGEDPIFDWAFLGDVHKQQIVPGSSPKGGKGTAVYPGSPIALNWGELEEDKGCLYVNLTGKSKPIQPLAVRGPRFRVLDLTDPKSKRFDPKELENDFVKVIAPAQHKTAGESDMLEELREKSKARWFKVITRKTKADIEKRSEVHAGMTHEQMLKEYIKVRPPEGLDESKVYRVGIKLLKEEEQHVSDK